MGLKDPCVADSYDIVKANWAIQSIQFEVELHHPWKGLVVHLDPAYAQNPQG